MTQKKELELRYIEMLRSQLPDFPEGEMELDGEEPDFVISNPRGIVGIEVRRLFKESKDEQAPKQAREAEAWKVVRLAQAAAEKQNIPIARVSVIFSSDVDLRKTNRSLFSGWLVEIVRNNLTPGECIPPEGKNVCIEGLELRGYPNFVDYVQISRFTELQSPSWVVLGGGWIQTECSGLFQKAISEKNELLPKYLKRCESCWLLLVADGNGDSSLLDPEPTSDTYISQFDRTFFLEAFSGRISHLITRKTESAI